MTVRPRTRGLALTGLALAGALVLTSCSGDSGSPKTEFVEGGTFVLAISTDIGSLDPHLSATSASLAAS